MSALQRKIADATVRRNKEEEEDESEHDGYPWPPGAWQRASDAIINGTWKPRPPKHYPILLTPDGLISSATELQKLAEMESPPEVIEAGQVDTNDQEIGKVTTICDVDDGEMERMREKAEVTPGIGIKIMFGGRRRFVWIVTALKADVSTGDEDEDEDEEEEEEEEASGSGKAGENVTAPSELAEPKPGVDGESENQT